MTDLLEANPVWTALFEGTASSREPHWLADLRREAFADFQRLGLPTSRNEDWKFTNLAALARTRFHVAAPGQVDAADVPAWDAHRLVSVNGRFDASRSNVGHLPAGAVAGSLAEALRQGDERVQQYLAKTARHDEHALTALNTACFHDGAFVFVPKDAALHKPIHLLFHSVPSSSGDGTPAAFPRVLVVLERGSKATLVEEYRGAADSAYFTCGVSEMFVHESAKLDHCKLQGEGLAATHIVAVYAKQQRSSEFASHLVSIGGSLVRNETDVHLAAEGCTATVNGLYFADDRQHVDNHTEIDHAQPHCASHELYKGILRGRGHGVFNGKIFVRPNAQKTDAKQTNKTLLLSDDAIIDTKPQLEIFADDVKCTHGATVGQLEENALFYLRSRGVGLEQARSLLTYAFANDLIQLIPVAPVRAQLGELLLAAEGLPADTE
jgi:Fe-S cluster assembly protein SufD